MTEQIIDILVRIGVLLLIYIGILLSGKIRSLLDAKLTDGQKQALDTAIDVFTKAADQMFKNEDPDGSLRLDYVQTQLIEAGYDLTDEVRAMIEAHVHDLPHGEGT